MSLEANDRKTPNLSLLPINHHLSSENEVKNCDTLMDTFEELSAKNRELLEILECGRRENAAVKRRYYDLKSVLDNLNSALEKNVRIFHQLYDDSKSALEMGRMSELYSPIVHKNLIVKTPPPVPSVSTLKPSTHNGNNVKSNTRRKLHIEPINLEEIRREIEEASHEPRELDEQSSSDTSLREGLSTIIEENLTHTVTRTPLVTTVQESSLNCDLARLGTKKSPVIFLDQLPSDIVEYHLQNRSNRNISTINVTDSFNMTDVPNFSSTPLKLETMRRLGLVPTERHNINDDFMTTRKRNSRSQNGAKSNLISPKNERTSTESKRSTPKNTKSSTSTGVKRLTTPPKRSSPPKKERVSSPPKREASPRLSQSLSQSMKRSFSLPKSPLFVNKRKKTNPEVKQEKVSSPRKPVTTTRPQRRAKPQVLKEQSLKNKIRRG